MVGLDYVNISLHTVIHIIPNLYQLRSIVPDCSYRLQLWQKQISVAFWSVSWNCWSCLLTVSSLLCLDWCNVFFVSMFKVSRCDVSNVSVLMYAYVACSQYVIVSAIQYIVCLV
ncbi:hypothetical protein EB796_020473 [Bugula neritina]|uniref:Uncharacterized protein n=1 Tax=Bugula neritina TaxID=10212 RepID=A0A7J7J662_BUGNE|nr:hypothetical protein EB796_020473 [Bugula neritina]